MTAPITTTLNRIREHGPCEEGWIMLLKGLNKTTADDEPLSFAKIVEINGLSDAIWCCRAEPQHAREWRLFAVWCGRQVQHLMKDARSITVLDVAERHANGLATDDELKAARDTAMDAAWAADIQDAALDAARVVTWATARVANAAAWAAAGDAALDAARVATWAGRNAARAAGDAAMSPAWAAAGVAAREAARDAQKAEFLRVVRTDESTT